MFPTVRRLLRLDRATIVLVTTVAVLATVVGITVASPPDAVRPADLDGRTWMSVPTGDGPGLVLLNGFSGLVEARARAGGDLPPGTRFAASGAGATLLAGPDGAVVVDDGLHDARSLHVPTRGAVLVGEDVLVVDPDGAVSIQRPGEEPTSLPLEGDDAVGEPVLDDEGAAWLLAEHAAGHRAWRVGEDLEPTARDVPPTTTSLAVVDGEVVAVTRTGIVAVSGGDDRPAPSGATVPTLAVGAGDAWAHAEGAQVAVVDGGRSSEITLDDPVDQLVVWSGAVLAVTAGGVHRVEDGNTTPVGEFDDAPRVHTDGGLLWLTSRNRVTAVWDDHTEVTFELAAIDLDLCVGDCEAGDVRRFLDEQEEEDERDEPSERTTTTLDRQQSPATTRQLRPPSVEPSIPTTTTTSTTTTRPPSTTTTTRDRSGGEGRSTTTRPRATATTEPTTTTRPPTTTTTAPPPPPRPQPTWLPPLLPGPSDPGPSDPGPGPGPSDPGPGNGGGSGRPPGPPPPPPESTTTAPASEPTTTTTEPTTTTTEPPPGSVSLVLGVDRSGGTATATVGVEGRAIDCDAVVSRRTTGTVSWSGAATNSQQVTLTWDLGASSSSMEEVTIANVGEGDLTVSFSACGVQTSRTVGDPDAPPSVSSMSVNPAQPEVGEDFTASVTVEESNGWTVRGARWTGGACGNERSVGGDGLSQTFTAEQAGRFCISVIVTLAGPRGAQEDQTRSGEVQVVDTTTSSTTTTGSTTTTTESTTTTTTAATTTTTESTTTTTEATTTTTTGDPSP